MWCYFVECLVLSVHSEMLAVQTPAPYWAPSAKPETGQSGWWSEGRVSPCWSLSVDYSTACSSSKHSRLITRSSPHTLTYHRPDYSLGILGSWKCCWMLTQTQATGKLSNQWEMVCCCFHRSTPVLELSRHRPQFPAICNTNSCNVTA